MSHKDQDRLQEKFLPFLMDRIVGDTAEALRDCTVVNRLFVQGPDPLFLMEACPIEFEQICVNLGLTPTEGRQAIEAAHWYGPAVLLEGSGLDPWPDTETLQETHGREMLWLLLASYSDCTEDGYQTEISLRERIRRAMTAGLRLGDLARKDRRELVAAAVKAAQKFIDSTRFTIDIRGLIHSDQDHAFYVAYKFGHKVCAVHTRGGLTFWGTAPSTTLEAEGITVQKVLSPQFGIVFEDSMAELSKLKSGNLGPSAGYRTL